MINIVDCPQCGRLFKQDEPWKRLCIGCYISGKKKESPRPQERPRAHQPIDNDMLKRLIMLCHPDKHGGSKMSVEITQKLLRMRDK
jgi:hypothetical protein